MRDAPKLHPGQVLTLATLAGAVTTAQSAVTSDVDTLSSDQSAVEDDQQSVQDDQSTLLVTGLDDQSSLTQASAKYTTAEQALSVAYASLVNAEAAVSQSQRDVDVVTQVDAQRVTEVEAQIQSQKDSLKDDRLTAPISGTVKSVQIKPGMEVSSAPSGTDTSDETTECRHRDRQSWFPRRRDERGRSKRRQCPCRRSGPTRAASAPAGPGDGEFDRDHLD